jgi:hypothetical protein
MGILWALFKGLEAFDWNGETPESRRRAQREEGWNMLIGAIGLVVILAVWLLEKTLR